MFGGRSGGGGWRHKSRDVYGGVRGLERRNGGVVKKMKESREGGAQWLWRKNRGKVSGGGLRRLDFVGESPFFFSQWSFGTRVLLTSGLGEDTRLLGSKIFLFCSR